MPEMLTRQVSSSRDNLALTNFYNIIKELVDEHSDNSQLLLLVAIELGDLTLVQEVMENYDTNPTQNISGRNIHIMRQFIPNYAQNHSLSPRSIVVSLDN
tara:strand:- start:1892 stop:2191 length:300 start_codon:yes stop_codon:yes gene_type:complete